MPPYSSLGFHLCRFEYNSIEKLQAVTQRMHDANFPYDVQWTDIDAMPSHLDSTYDKNKFHDLADLVRSVQSSMQPAGTYPPYDDGLKEAIFIKTRLELCAWKEIHLKRSFVLSRSSFVKFGQYAAHWIGDNSAPYEDTYFPISAILIFNMFGITHVGADICGFRLDITQAEQSSMETAGSVVFRRFHGILLQEPSSWELKNCVHNGCN
ncbi:unnamed protein product [Adineta ricciae]|uniref:Glycoside hydrolase family 31 TIM barrel domain-containing protein n=1 Tax=Adineta ricciae TaxID=249248 RepID=A0A814XPS5_ADIRI|nr:unnamed protein product [Adineta ricciae]CAF1216320.1 unnamed protein product [Adineta ricciae]